MLRKVAVWAFLTVTSSAMGQDHDRPDLGFRQHRSADQGLLALGMNYYNVKTDFGQLSGIALEVGQLIPLRPDLAARIMMSQAYSSDNDATVLYSDIGVGLRYCLTGSLVRETDDVYLGDQVVLAGKSGDGGNVLSIGISVHQLFFNTTDAAIPYSGLSTEVLYDLPLVGDFRYAIGTRFGQANNGEAKIRYLQVFFQAGIFL